MSERKPIETLPEAASENATDLGRREALEKLGKLAGYTAPVMLTLLLTSKKAAASPTGPTDPF